MNWAPMNWKEHFSRFMGADPQDSTSQRTAIIPGRTSASRHSKRRGGRGRLDGQQMGPIFGEVIPRPKGMSPGCSVSPTPRPSPSPPTLTSWCRGCSLPSPGRPGSSPPTPNSTVSPASRGRLEEQGWAIVTRIPLEPLDSFPDRFSRVAAAGGNHLVYFSHVAYDSGYVVPDLSAVVNAVPDRSTAVVIDGYHGFMALPTDLGAMAERSFYTAGGYKYAMAGEGVCHLHCPPGFADRPVDTGWLAGFGALEEGTGQEVSYPAGRREVFRRHLRPERAVPVQRRATLAGRAGNRRGCHPQSCRRHPGGAARTALHPSHNRARPRRANPRSDRPAAGAFPHLPDSACRRHATTTPRPPRYRRLQR